MLERYFTGNPSGLTERDARIYSHYLQTEHNGFVKLADELAADRWIHTEGVIYQQTIGIEKVWKRKKRQNRGYWQATATGTITHVWITCLITVQLTPKVTGGLLTFWLNTLMNPGGTRFSGLSGVVSLQASHRTPYQTNCRTGFGTIRRAGYRPVQKDNHNLNTLWLLANKLLPEVNDSHRSSNFRLIKEVVKKLHNAHRLNSCA